MIYISDIYQANPVQLCCTIIWIAAFGLPDVKCLRLRQSYTAVTTL